MRRLFALLLTISLISCADPNRYTINGEALGFEDGSKIYVHKILDNNQAEVIDTLIAKINHSQAPILKTTNRLFISSRWKTRRIPYCFFLKTPI